jgi:hypothetical protein
MEDKMEVVRMLVLSTAHVSKETADLLNERGSEALFTFYPKGDYGWMIPVQRLQHEKTGAISVANPERMPGDLVQVMVMALNERCEWVMFDCDADQIPGLPVYEW